MQFNWGSIGVLSVLAFIIGWFLFGLLGAVVLGVIVCAAMGILKF